MGRTLMIVGAVLLGVGALLLLGERLGLGLGKLPGDLSWRGKGWSVHFPLVTSIVLSLVLTLLLNLFRR